MFFSFSLTIVKISFWSSVHYQKSTAARASLPYNSMPAFTRRNRRVVCPACEGVFAHGHGFQNHARSCLGEDGSSANTVPAKPVEGDADLNGHGQQ